MSTTNNAFIDGFRRLAAATIVSVCALGFVGVSSADDGRDIRQITVKFADLNVSTPEGAAALYGRIRSAAKSVCGPDSSYPFNSGFNGCVRKAISDAVTKVNRMELYAVYNQHNKPPLPETLVSQSR